MRHRLVDVTLQQYLVGKLTFPELVGSLQEIEVQYPCDCLGCTE